MATKSNNTIGNPYHDENGRFTSENGGGAGSNVDNQAKVQAETKYKRKMAYPQKICLLGI